MPTAERTDTDRKATAYHEAGHAVAYALRGPGTRDASIVPGDGNLGHVGPMTGAWDTVEGAERRVVAMLAGEAAERRFTDGADPCWTTGSRTDHGQAHDVLRALGHESADERKQAVARLYERAKRLLREDWHRVERVANLLLRYERLDGQVVDVAVNVEDDGQREAALRMML